MADSDFEEAYVRKLIIRGQIIVIFVAVVVTELWVIVAHLIRAARTIKV